MMNFSTLDEVIEYCKANGISIQNENVHTQKEILKELGFYHKKALGDMAYCKSQVSRVEEIIKSTKKISTPINRNKPHRNKEKAGYVYLIRGESGRYKIGRSINPEIRLRQLRLSSCEDHKLVHKIKSDRPYRLEQELHVKYKNRSTHTEWFSLTQSEVLDIMDMK